jgi:hypothetical protein
MIGEGLGLVDSALQGPAGFVADLAAGIAPRDGVSALNHPSRLDPNRLVISFEVRLTVRRLNVALDGGRTR